MEETKKTKKSKRKREKNATGNGDIESSAITIEANGFDEVLAVSNATDLFDTGDSLEQIPERKKKKKKKKTESIDARDGNAALGVNVENFVQNIPETEPVGEYEAGAGLKGEKEKVTNKKKNKNEKDRKKSGLSLYNYVEHDETSAMTTAEVASYRQIFGIEISPDEDSIKFKPITAFHQLSPSLGSLCPEVTEYITGKNFPAPSPIQVNLWIIKCAVLKPI